MGKDRRGYYRKGNTRREKNEKEDTIMLKKLTRITAIVMSLCMVVYLMPYVVFSVLSPSYNDPGTDNETFAAAWSDRNEEALEAMAEAKADVDEGFQSVEEYNLNEWFKEAPMDGVLPIADIIPETWQEELATSSDLEPAEETEASLETEVTAVAEETEAIEEIDTVKKSETIEEIEELTETAEEIEIPEEDLQTDAVAEAETIDETETEVAAVVEAEITEPEPEIVIPAPIGISATYIGSKYVGETMTASDLVVAVTMSDGSVITNPEGFIATPLLLTAQNDVTVSYMDVACSIRFEAPERPVLKITDAPAMQVAARSTKLPVSNEIMIEYTGPTTVGTPIDPNMLICYVEAGIDRYYAGTYSMTAQSDVFLPGINPLTVTLNGNVYTLNVIGQEANPYGICSDGFDREDAVKVFRLQNEMRIAAGRKPLLWSEELYLIASARATWAVNENGAISHNGKITTGENCFAGPFYGTPLSAEYKIDAYSRSNSHKNTILKAKYEYGAVSTYYGVSYSVFETSGWDSRLADAINIIRDTKGAYIPCE